MLFLAFQSAQEIIGCVKLQATCVSDQNCSIFDAKALGLLVAADVFAVAMAAMETAKRTDRKVADMALSDFAAIPRGALGS